MYQMSQVADFAQWLDLILMWHGMYHQNRQKKIAKNFAKQVFTHNHL